MTRCINIDWLEIYCLEPTTKNPLNAEYFENLGYFVSVRDYGTRMYGEMFTIFDEHNVPMIEVRRKPLSTISKAGGLFDERSCHIRLTNIYCYVDNPVDALRQFLAKHQYIFMKIFRIDIALDFSHFDKGDDPQKFMKRYINGIYSKVNQTNISAHGSDKWEMREWNSISWGRPKSMVSTKFYCKSQELKEVKDKPYIRQSWWHAGLIDNPITGEKRQQDGTLSIPNIWRVEFSIKSSAKRWFIIERADTRKQNKIAVYHSLSMYESKQKLIQMFASLANHYFRFKIYEKDKRKDRCKDKTTFDFKYIDTYYHIDKLANNTPTKSNAEKLIQALEKLQHNTIDLEIKKACQIIVRSLKRTQISQFAGTQMSAEDIFMIQHLIALQTDKSNTKTLQENIDTLHDMIANGLDIF